VGSIDEERHNMDQPFRQVAIVGVYSTKQARVLEGHDADTINLEAALGAIEDAGLSPRDVDGVIGQGVQIVHAARSGPVWRSRSGLGIPTLFEAAGAIACGLADIVLISAGNAGAYRRSDGPTDPERAATAPWTRPSNEYVAPYGMITPAEFALVAREHMHRYGTTPEALATVSATIRNNGHVNPLAGYFGRGPYTAEDVLASRMIADPFHLLDCAMTGEGGCALVVSRLDLARDLAKAPIHILGGGQDTFGAIYQHPPTFDMGGNRRADLVNGWVGRRAAENAFNMSGLKPSDVDVCEMYDPFSFEIIRQFEAFGFCGEGEGGDFVMDGTIGPGGRLPVNTDGGLMSFGHPGNAAAPLAKAVRAVQQLRGECPTRQVEGAEVALCAGGGSGALFNDVMLLGKEQA
jgi:acetyl-CoA acetyltransferase